MAQMEYCGTTSFFIRTLLDKKYALPYRVIDALVGGNGSVGECWPGLGGMARRCVRQDQSAMNR